MLQGCIFHSTASCTEFIIAARILEVDLNLECFAFNSSRSKWEIVLEETKGRNPNGEALELLQMLESCSDWVTPSKTFQITELILPTSCSARTLPCLNFSFLWLTPFFSYHLWLAKNHLHSLCMFGNYPVNLSCLSYL